MLAQESESNEQWVEEVGYYPAPEVFKDIAGAKRTMPSSELKAQLQYIHLNMFSIK